MTLSDDELNVLKTGADALIAPYREIVVHTFGPLADQIGEMLGDYGRQFRTKQLIKILGKVQAYAENAGIKVHVIPPRILLPSIHFASLEDEDCMQDKWAALLANAASGEGLVQPSFSEVLHALTPLEARIADTIYDNFVVRSEIDVRVFDSLDDILSLLESHSVLVSQNDFRDWIMSVEGLVRHGLLVRIHSGGRMDEFMVPSASLMDKDKFFGTRFGNRFIAACRPPLRESPRSQLQFSK